MLYSYTQRAPVLFGAGAISALGERVAGMGCKRALVLFGKNIEASGAAKKAMDSLLAAGVAAIPFNGVLTDPPIEVIDQAGALGLAERVDCIVAVGGGSTMDTGKATAILLENPGPIKNYILSNPIQVDTKIPVVLVPTTSGTGAECTHVAVVSRTDLNEKWSVFVNITLAVVDPELTLTLPKFETAYTGLDALAHATECLTSVFANPRSDVLALDAVRRIHENLEKCCRDGGDLEARSELSLAANLAGIAFDDACCHVGHSIADALSVAYHTPHGLNCALALPATMRLVAAAQPCKMKQIANAMGLGAIEDAEKCGDAVAEEIYRLMRAVELPSMSALGLDRDKVKAKDVSDNHLSSFCPVEITEAVAEKLLKDVCERYI